MVYNTSLRYSDSKYNILKFNTYLTVKYYTKKFYQLMLALQNALSFHGDILKYFKFNLKS